MEVFSRSTILYLLYSLAVQIPWSDDEQLLAAWREARTGYPWIDAIMVQVRRGKVAVLFGRPFFFHCSYPIIKPQMHFSNGLVLPFII